MKPISDQFAEAMSYALSRHRQQQRKGTDVPYISHLMQVSGLVLEAGGDEEQAIAGLLHDAIEDAPAGKADQVRAEIGERFGERVLSIVEGCTDADEQPKPPWKPRKKRYIRNLPNESRDVLLVSTADKLHNARSILTDLQEHGDALWNRFRGGKEGTLWYYRTLAETYREIGANNRLLTEFESVVKKIEELAS